MNMVPQFIYGGNTGIMSAQDLERQRMLVEALQGPRPTPKNLGEGLSALGEALGYRMARSRLAKGEKEGMKAGQTLFDSLFGGTTEITNPTEAQPATYAPDAVQPSFAEKFNEAMPSQESEIPAPPIAGEPEIDMTQTQPVPELQVQPGKPYQQPLPVQQPQQAPIETMELRTLLQVRRDPRWQYLDEGQRSFIDGRIDEEFKRRYRQNDPEYNLGLQKLQLEVEGLRNPKLSPAEQSMANWRDAQLAFEREKFEYEKALKSGKWSKLSDNSLFNDTTGEIKQFPGAVPPPELNDVSGIRKEVQDTPQIKNYMSAAPIYRGMVETAPRNTRASDLALVYGLGKIMDPTSVVREGEMFMVQGVNTLPQKLVEGMNSLLTGSAALTPQTRKTILDEAKTRMKAYRSEADSLKPQYEGLSKRYNIPIEDIWQELPVLQDYTPPEEEDMGWTTLPNGVKIRRKQ